MKDGKVKFEETVSWGIDLGSEHERYLSEKVSCCNSNMKFMFICIHFTLSL